MKLVLCTLAVCLTILLSAFSISNLVQSEAKKTRSAFAKTLGDSESAETRKDPIAQKLERVCAQLSSVERRLSGLESAIQPYQTLAKSEASHPENRALDRNLNSISTSLKKLDGVPGYLTSLSAYLDRSFDHVEKTVSSTAWPDSLQTSLSGISDKLDTLEGDFLPLYLFMGLPSDPNANSLLADYPTVDERINDLSQQLSAISQELTTIHGLFDRWIIAPRRYPSSENDKQ